MPGNDSVPAPGAVRIRGGALAMGPQRQQLRPMVTARSAGSRALCSGDVVMDPAHYSVAHVHECAEIIVRILDGFAATVTWDPDGTVRLTRHQAGEDVYVPPGVPHAAINLSRSKPVLTWEVRTDPDFNADVVPRPDLDTAIPELAQHVQDEHLDRVRVAQARGEFPWC